MKPLDHLRQLIRDDLKRKHPNVPEHALAVNTFDNAKPEKREKKRIEKFLELMPQCTGAIIENRGQRIDRRKINIDAAGFVREIGSVEWIGSGMKRGISDLKAVIQGKAVDIELKRRYKKGKDSQSEHQKAEEVRITEAGGIYMIVESFNDFYEKFYEIYTPADSDQ